MTVTDILLTTVAFDCAFVFINCFKFDCDESGTIDTDELGNLIRVLGWDTNIIKILRIKFQSTNQLHLNWSRYSLWSLNPSDDEVKTLRKEIDEDDNGELDFNEFCELMNSETLRWI